MSVKLSNTERMLGFPRGQFIREYTQALDESRAALFLGAGASIPAGFVDWRSLLADIATDLDLEMDRVTDLLSLAQYHENERGGRNKINQAILDEFDRIAKRTPIYDALVRLPVHEIWTTNYDPVTERAFEDAWRTVDVKVTKESLNVSKRGRDVVLYKMHGDSKDSANAVITRDDYEKYSESARGRAFMTSLTAALSARTFLFVGFSFSDPNIAHVLARMRLLFASDRPEHYAIFKRPTYFEEITDPEKRAEAKFVWRSTELQIADLKRFGVHVVLVDEYDDIAPVLRAVVKSSRRNDVFVSGAAHEAGTFGEDRLVKLSQLLGERLAIEGKHLICGLGLGVGLDVVQGFFKAGFDGKAQSVGERATLRPFPQRAPGGETGRAEFWRAYRHDMLRGAGFVIYIAGNKVDRAAASVVLSNGMYEEFDIAQQYGAIPIPIGATGFVAKELWERIAARPGDYFPDAEIVKDDLLVLNDSSATNERIIHAVLNVMRSVAKSYF